MAQQWMDCSDSDGHNPEPLCRGGAILHPTVHPMSGMVILLSELSVVLPQTEPNPFQIPDFFLIVFFLKIKCAASSLSVPKHCSEQSTTKPKNMKGCGRSGEGGQALQLTPMSSSGLWPSCKRLALQLSNESWISFPALLYLEHKRRRGESGTLNPTVLM